MQRFLVASLLALVLAGLGAPPAAAKSDVVTAEAIEVGPFDRLEISGHAELTLVQGTREAVVVEASPKSRARIHVRAQDGRVTIEVDESRSWLSWLGGDTPEPTIVVHFRTLESLTMNGAIRASSSAIVTPKLRVAASGAASMRVDALKADALRFSGSGAVKGTFAGTATDLGISISGAGAFRAPKLATQTASVQVSGAGKVIVNAQKTLDASISGAGAIEYFGDPVVKQRVSGAGKITRRSATEVGTVRLRVAHAPSVAAVH